VNNAKVTPTGLSWSLVALAVFRFFFITRQNDICNFSVADCVSSQDWYVARHIPNTRFYFLGLLFMPNWQLTMAHFLSLLSQEVLEWLETEDGPGTDTMGATFISTPLCSLTFENLQQSSVPSTWLLSGVHSWLLIYILTSAFHQRHYYM
jgi:hypothetical protein